MATNHVGFKCESRVDKEVHTCTKRVGFVYLGSLQNVHIHVYSSIASSLNVTSSLAQVLPHHCRMVAYPQFKSIVKILASK